MYLIIKILYVIFNIILLSKHIQEYYNSTDVKINI